MGNDAEGDLVMIRTITVPSCIKKGFLIMRNNSRSIISKDNNENVYSMVIWSSIKVREYSPSQKEASHF